MDRSDSLAFLLLVFWPDASGKIFTVAFVLEVFLQDPSGHGWCVAHLHALGQRAWQAVAHHVDAGGHILDVEVRAHHQRFAGQDDLVRVVQRAVEIGIYAAAGQVGKLAAQVGID